MTFCKVIGPRALQGNFSISQVRIFKATHVATRILWDPDSSSFVHMTSGLSGATIHVSTDRKAIEYPDFNRYVKRVQVQRDGQER
jgi:hypothetical protein